MWRLWNQLSPCSSLLPACVTLCTACPGNLPASGDSSESERRHVHSPLCQGLRCTPAVLANPDMRWPCQTSAQSPVPRTECPEVPTQSALPHPYSPALCGPGCPTSAPASSTRIFLHTGGGWCGVQSWSRASPGCIPLLHSSRLFSCSPSPGVWEAPATGQASGQRRWRTRLSPWSKRRPLRGLLPLPPRVRRATAPSHSAFWVSLHPKCSGSPVSEATGPDSGQRERAA